MDFKKLKNNQNSKIEVNCRELDLKKIEKLKELNLKLFNHESDHFPILDEVFESKELFEIWEKSGAGEEFYLIGE